MFSLFVRVYVRCMLVKSMVWYITTKDNHSTIEAITSANSALPFLVCMYVRV